MGLSDNQTLVAALAASHGNQLQRFLRARVRNAVDVADIVQETYLRILRVSHVESIRSPEAYLFTVAQHVLQQHSLRQSAPRSVALAQLLDSPFQAASGADPELEVGAQQCLEGLQYALNQLSPKVRAAFMLHRRDGWPIEQIGEHLKVSRPMVKKYLVRALTQLRKQLKSAE